MIASNTDGRDSLVLEVNGPAFASALHAFCIGCPEKKAGEAEANAWAQRLRDGVAAALPLSSGQWCCCTPAMDGRDRQRSCAVIVLRFLPPASRDAVKRVPVSPVLLEKGSTS